MTLRYNIDVGQTRTAMGGAPDAKVKSLADGSATGGALSKVRVTLDRGANGAKRAAALGPDASARDSRLPGRHPGKTSAPRQIVVTEGVRNAVGDPAGIQLRPLGTFALKGLAAGTKAGCHAWHSRCAGVILLYRVSGRAMAGNCDDAATEVQTALALYKNEETLRQGAFAASLCNVSKIALPILAGLAKAYPSNTLVNRAMIPQSRAALALAAHQPAQALEELEGSERFALFRQEPTFAARHI